MQQFTSPRFHLTQEDMSKWTTNLAVFSMPAILIFLVSLQNHASLDIAFGAAYSALLASSIDLLKKYISQH